MRHQFSFQILLAAAIVIHGGASFFTSDPKEASWNLLPRFRHMSGRLSDYDYHLPRELIATRPLPQREDARMLVLYRKEQRIEHRRFVELKEFLRTGDLLVLNDTRVLTARRFSDNGKIEFLFLERLSPTRWKCLVRPGKKMRLGAAVRVGGVHGLVTETCSDGERIIAFEKEMDAHKGGHVPLPPYIGRQSDAQDETRYQTVFAGAPGALAAPTAGLHFTPEILRELPHVFVTLHVGVGTFRPVHAENVADHRMHAERFSVSDESASAINQAKRIVAVGTTTLRVLESARRDAGKTCCLSSSVLNDQSQKSSADILRSRLLCRGASGTATERCGYISSR